MPRRQALYGSAPTASVVPDPSETRIKNRRRQKLWIDDAYWRHTPWGTRLRRLAHSIYDWKTEHQFLGRYSVDKLLHFDAYLLHAIPMVDPQLGAAANWRLFVRSAVDHSIVGVMFILTLKQSNRMDNLVYPIRQAIWISTLTAISNELVWGGTAFLWRFPVPYRELLGTPTWMGFMALYHALFLRSVITARWSKLRLSLLIAATQFTVLFSFIALSLAVARASSTALQIGLVTVAAVVKVVLKRKLWEFARRQDDLSTDVTICLVEFAGSLFQTVCLQRARSSTLAALIAVGDVLQAIVEVWMYLSHNFIVDGRQTMETATKIVESALFPAEPEAKDATPKLFVKSSVHGSVLRRARSDPSVMCASSATGQASPAKRRVSLKAPSLPVSVFLPPRLIVRKNASITLNLQHPSATAVDHGIVIEHHSAMSDSNDAKQPSVRVTRRVISIDGIAIPRRDQARVLEQSLQLLFSCEVLLFAESVEVMLPLLYAAVITALWHLPNARFSLIVRDLTASDISSLVLWALTQSAIEACSFLAMATMLRRRYGVSAVSQMAFVQEAYWKTIQGKVLGSFLVILNLAAVHQGVM
ncbi:hypothetical protein ATCC90586_001966 [Pythium insidiosum]|nr:hypothetical protein ATCC90586_001966 [Pythium insidiosum]